MSFVYFFNRLKKFALFASFTALLFTATSASFAQESATLKESVKIKPYTGPPIFLEESTDTIQPTLTRREIVTEKFKDDRIRIEREIAHFSDNHFEADGKYREYFPNGQIFVEGQYKRGRQHGEWTFYYDNGKVNRKAKFVDGQPEGPREIFRADGTLLAKRSYNHGLRDGEWVAYDPTGKIPLSEEHYKKGKEDGVWKFWHPNGQLKQQISLKEGIRHGTATEWDEKGTKRFEATFDQGKLHGTATRWFPDGRKVVQQYDQGKLVSQSS